MRLVPNFKGYDFFPHDLRLPFMKYRDLAIGLSIVGMLLSLGLFFFALIRVWGAERQWLHDREFIEGWVLRCTAATSASQALEDSTARAIIARRETDARPGRQRLRVRT